MKTFNTLVSDYKTLSHDDSSANELLGKSLINTFINRILGMKDWTFNRGSLKIHALSEEWSYPKAYNAERIIGIKVQVDDDVYWPKEVINRDDWERLVRNRTAVSSDIVQRYFVDIDTIEVYPTFSRSASDNDVYITQYYQKFNYDLAQTDYVTGTISRSASSRTVTGAGTTFTEAMVGRYIKFSSDPYWDKIESVVNATTLVTARASRTATDDDTTCISELIPLSFGFEEIPLHWALEVYFEQKENPTQAKMWKEMRIEGLETLLRRDAKSVGQILEKEDLLEIINQDINKFPTGMV